MERNILFIVAVCLLQYASGQSCDLKTKADPKNFPDLFAESALSYQMTVLFTLPKGTQTDYYKEYYDQLNKEGRVDSHVAGVSSIHYYYQETAEAFSIQGEKCKTMSLKDTPEFMKDFQKEWIYPAADKDDFEIHGPSAMFRYAWKTWKDDGETMAYMGILDDKLRGLTAQLWRRCYKDFTIDYYFTTESHDDAFNFKLLTQIPLRVTISKEKADDIYPQTYEIVIFQPFVSKELDTLKVPAGLGCYRNDTLVSKQMPDYQEGSIFTYGEVIYTDLSDKSPWSYYSTFNYALDIRNQHVSYLYTPWDTSKEKRGPGGLKRTIYDTKHQYIYNINLVTGDCEIGRQPNYDPLYYFPNGAGYIDLTDAYILYPNSEFSYLDEDTDRGLPVDAYETVVPGYVAGNVSYGKAIFTRNYFMDNVTDGENILPRSLASIQAKFFKKGDDDAHAVEVRFNFYGFRTQIPFRTKIFDTSECFKNSDDALWITLGFPSDRDTLEVAKVDVPSIENNAIEQISLKTELNMLRIPYILVDINPDAEIMYITLEILAKPPLQLDFNTPEDGKTLSSPTLKVKVMATFESCATACLEEEATCWAISICGNTCFMAVDDKAEVTIKGKCQLYSRYNNDTYLISKDTLANNLKSAVTSSEIAVVVPAENGKRVTINAQYIEISQPSDPDTILSFLGRETSPRLRILNAGSKLVSTGDVARNLGRMRYDACQKICLDYRVCETLSYCAKGAETECILSKKFGDEIPKANIKEDMMCAILTRRYSDEFVNSPGTIFSLEARKTLKASDVTECARACVKETSFSCLSFDFCPMADGDTCRLHAIHFLDGNNKENTRKNATCGHYYKKYSYDFVQQPNRQAVASGLIAITNTTLEVCAKSCVDYSDGTCQGYDFCQDKDITSTSCTLLVDEAHVKNTIENARCNHYTKAVLQETTTTLYSYGKAAWVGILCFVVAVVVGILLTLGIAYWRTKKR